MTTPFEQMGGEPFFTSLVARFYEGVAQDPVLRPMYPEEVLDAAERRLRMFLIQYWGGPTTYSDERGHPRLRMRHAPFVIDDDGRTRWLAHMADALAATEQEHPLSDELRTQLWRYLESAALSMVNSWPEHSELPMS